MPPEQGAAGSNPVEGTTFKAQAPPPRGFFIALPLAHNDGEGVGDAVDEEVRAVNRLPVHLGRRLLLEVEHEGGRSPEMDVVASRVLAAPGAQKERQRPHGRKLRRGPADVEQPVVEARLGRDAEVATVGGPHLYGYQIGIVPFRMRGASRLRPQDIHLEGKHLQVVEQLIDGTFQIEHGAGAAGLLATVHGVKRDSGVQTEGERLGEVAAVDASARTV